MISRIRIRDFKSLSDVTVDLGPLTVLVGRSGTGKTNFVAAIRCLRDLLRADSHPDSIIRRTTPFARNSSSLTFEVDFVVGEPYRYEMELAPGKDPLIRRERLSVNDSVLFEQSNGKWAVQPNLGAPPEVGKLLSLGRLSSVPEIVTAFAALTEGIGCHEFGSETLTTVGPANVAGSSKQGYGLNDDASNYLHVVRQLTAYPTGQKTRRELLATLRQLNPGISAVELDSLREPRGMRVSHEFNGVRYEFDLAQESSGFRRFYAHLLALHQTPPKQTLIFEEPENGIYPGAMALLAEEFRDASESGRGQVILTTHSPVLLDHFRADEIRVVEIDGGNTRIGPLAEDQREMLKQNLLEAGELLTVDPARSGAPA